MLRKVAAAVELVVAIAVIVTVVLLFTNEPSAPPPARAVAGGVDGADVFARNCASCHGGDGSGGIGPRLSGGRVVEDFPDPVDQIRFVTYGRDPAIEVLVPKAYAPEGSLLPAFAHAALALPTTGRKCS